MVLQNSDKVLAAWPTKGGMVRNKKQNGKMKTDMDTSNHLLFWNTDN